jgi:hypothetical protein
MLEYWKSHLPEQWKNGIFASGIMERWNNGMMGKA